MTDAVTTELFRALVIRGDREALCSALAPLTEKQRSELADNALAIAAAINTYWGPSGVKGDEVGEDTDNFQAALLQNLRQEKYVDWRVPRWNANLLVAGVCDRKALEKPWNLELSWLRSDLADMPERLLQILIARNPKWLANWLEYEWKQESPIANSHIERGLIRAGLIPNRRDSGYYMRLSSSTMLNVVPDAQKTDKQIQRHRNVRALLESDSGLLTNEIWGFFEFDSYLFRYCLDSWGQTLVSLSQEGKVDRQKLLHQSLVGMSLPLAPTTLNGMGKFHEMLAPTIEERQGLLREYLALLDANESTVVGHALKALDELLKAKRLDGAAFLQAVPGVFRVEKKAQPTKAMKITQKLLKHDSSLEIQAARALLPGLAHANPDVQEESLKILDSINSPLTDDIVSKLAKMRGEVAVSLHSQVDALVTKHAGNAGGEQVAAEADQGQLKSKAGKQSPPPTGNARAPQDEALLQNLVQRARKMPDSMQQATCVAQALRAIDSGQPLDIDSIRSDLIPRRNVSRRIDAIASVDELIEVVAATVERIDDIMDLERILDGISKFHAERPTDFDKKTSALKKRIGKLSEQHSGTILDSATRVGFTQLLITWLEMPPLNRSEPVHWYSMRGWFLRERINSLRNRVEKSRRPFGPEFQGPLPLLALPTHEGGWIDSVELVRRINENYMAHRELIDHYDLAQAMLRLMPDGRADALQMLGDPGYYNGGNLLRYALGDPCEWRISGGWGGAAAAVAAVRARLAIEPDIEPALPIARARFGADQRVVVEGAVKEDPTVPFSLVETAFSIEPFTATAIAPDDKQFWQETWESLSNPADTVASCMAGHLSHLLDSEATWTYAACRLCIAAAGHERGETRIFATDALLEAAGRGLVPPTVLATALADLMPHVKLNRVSKVLGDASGESNLHRWTIAAVIEHTIANLAELPKDVHMLLSLLLELKTAIGIPVADTAKEKLASISGASKTAKLAKQVLAVRPRPAARAQINSLLLAMLVERADRWGEES